MKGRVIVLGKIDGREAAALMVDGHLEDLLVSPGETDRPMPGAIYRAVADRPMKGQGGVMVRLPEGGKGFLRKGKGVAMGTGRMVQVTGVAEDGKAAPVSDRLLLKSRFAIVTPGAPGLNVARSIRDEEERLRLHEIIVEVMQDADPELGLILRSATHGAEVAEIVEDIVALRALGEALLADNGDGPECLLAAPAPREVAWREWSEPAADAVVDEADGFATEGVLDALEALRTPRVELSGGASAYVEPTRALVAVDVNTGGDSSTAAGLKANIALSRDLPRQLRLRGLGGQVTIDFAPMPKRDRKVLEQTLTASFRADKVETSLVGWTPLGHFELQRKRERLPLLEVLPR